MEISHEQQSDGWTELRVKGRLDSYWADHFQTALDELIRAGNQKIRLNLAGVTYVSSAGIGVLVRCHKELENIRGKLVVANPSEPVKEVLHVTRLNLVLATEAALPRPGQASTVAQGRRVFRQQVTFELFESLDVRALRCQLIGDPGRLNGCRFGADDCRRVQFPDTTLGIGLGALGSDFDDCQGRFGEFLAAAGAAAYLPTDGSHVPDYLVAGHGSVPELQVCYGLRCEGPLAHFSRFEVNASAGRVPLSTLVAGCLDVAEVDRIGLVFLGEAAGLMGAALRRAPVLGAAADAPFAFPQVRDWLSFTAERAYMHCMALVVGVAARGEPGPLAPLVRPLGKEPGLVGHFHAAAFSYRPLPRGEIDLRSTVAGLFEHQTLQGLLHLLADNRPAIGLGESEFVRGACWFGPVDAVETLASGGC
jgi:anti-anti-sigma factor